MQERVSIDLCESHWPVRCFPFILEKAETVQPSISLERRKISFCGEVTKSIRKAGEM